MKRILFIGAGASIPFFNPRLTTSLLTDTIQDSQRWNSISDEYNSLIHIRGEEVNPTLIIDIIRNAITRYNLLNFEEIIEIIDKICSFNFDDLDHKIFHQILRNYNLHSDPYSNNWALVPFLARELIADRILELQNLRIPSYYDLIQSQTNFISTIQDPEGISVISLNYDDLFLNSANQLGFITGFQNERFNIELFLNSLNVIMFPHGHIRFNLDSQGILYYDNSMTARNQRFQNLSQINLAETRYLLDSKYCYNFNTFLVTGQAKESTFDNNPYSLYYQRMAIDLFTSQEIYIIGYSFSDPHFNRLIMNFLEFNECNRIIVITMINNDINIIQDFMDQNSTVKKILSLVNIDSIPLDNQGNQYLYQQNIDFINTNGFGCLHPRIFLYKNGYESFLNDYDTFIQFIHQ